MTQDYEEIVRQSIVILVVMSVAFPIGGIGIGSAQQQVSISPDFPDRPTAGERTSVSFSIETPDLTPLDTRSISTDAEINLYVDGSLVNSRNITIGDGEVISSDVGHTFQEGGSKNVRIEVVGSLRNLEFPSVSGTVDVQRPDILVNGKPELSRVDLRSSTEVDDSVGVDAEVTAPEFGETDSAQLSASLLVDGEQVSEKPLTDINPEGERSISFNPTFESTGQKNVTLKITLLLTLAEQTRKLSVSKSTSIDVYKNVSGAMFNTPDSLQEEVTRYRENLSEVALSDLPQETRNDINNTSQFVQNRTNSSVLATENQIYIVLGRQEMDIERVSVRGFVLDKNLTDDITFGVIAATEISDVQPEPVNIQDVTTNSEEYQLDSVQIESHHRRISLRYDPDEAGFAETKLNVGVLTNDPITQSDLFSNLGSRAANASDSRDESTTLTPIDDARSPYLRTVSFSTEEQFWIDAPAEVRGLILRSDSPAVNFLQQYYPSQVEYLKDERQILYVTDTNLSPQNVSDVQEINSRADSLNQEVVQTEVNLADGVISTQENIEYYSPGGPERLQIPANPPVSINVVVDTAIHTGIGWNAQPRSRDDTIFIIGASSTKIDQSLAEQKNEILSQANISQGNISQANVSGVVGLLGNKTGRYRLTGEVVSTSQVAESLPEGAVFLIYNIEQISETIEFKDPSQGLIQTDFGTLRSKITEQLDTENTAISPTTKIGSVAQVPGDSTSRVTLSGIRSGSVSAQQLTFNTTTAVQDVSVSVSQPATTPDSIPSPPPGVLDVLNISTSIADSRIQQSKIQLQVYNAAVPADRELIVYRYDGNSWVPVSTNTVRTTETTTTVASTVSDFSYFAVGHTDTNPTPTPTPTAVTFENQTVTNGSTTVTVASAQFGNQSVLGEDFVVVVHETDDGEIGTKIGESPVLEGNQTQSNIPVNLSKQVVEADDVARVTEPQELVAMLHTTNTTSGDNNHGTNDLGKNPPVTDRAQVAPLSLQTADVNETTTNQPGQPVEITATVQNEGATDDTIQLTFIRDGDGDGDTEQLNTQNVTVASETTRTVSVPVTPTQTETFSVQGPASSKTVTIDVANLSLTDATLVTQEPVTTTETVVVNATVTNTGTATGVIPLSLTTNVSTATAPSPSPSPSTNGTVLNTTTQEVDPGETVTAPLTAAESLSAGTQTLTVKSSLDNQTATATVGAGELVVAPPEAITNATVRIGSGSVGPGGTTTVNLTLEQAPQGLAGYNLTAGVGVSVADSNDDGDGDVRVVNATAPSIFNNSVTETTIGSANQTAEIRATDITEVVEANENATNTSLGTVTVAATESANVSQTELTVSVSRIDDDRGRPINVTTQNGTVTVREQGPLAPGLNPPADPDNDGVFEDLNGNGRVDFNDVVILFENLPDAETPFQDVNGNGRIDFDDIVELFKEI